jgi:hypothetical protein
MGFIEIRAYVWLCLAWFLVVLKLHDLGLLPTTIITLTLISEREM